MKSKDEGVLTSIRLEGALGVRRRHSLSDWAFGRRVKTPKSFQRYHPNGCILLLYNQDEHSTSKRSSSFSG